jgi:arylsulfatase A-like enzyme
MINKNSYDKNIILISIDSLRADHLHCLGYHKNITPTIDKLASDGLLFTNAFSNAPYTPYSIPSFITSRIPPLQGKIKNTIAYILKKNGYNTAAFNPNAIVLSDTFEGCNILNGFDVFDLLLSYKIRSRLTIDFLRMEFMKYFRTKFNEESIIYKIVYSLYNKIIKMNPLILCSKDYNYIPNAEMINNHAIEWIKKQKGKFFIWLHYMDVHQPYAPDEYTNKKELIYLITKYRDFPNMLTDDEIKKIILLYDLEIKYTDNKISKFIQDLKNNNKLENTIIIITSDHGEAFGEHGAFGHGGQFKVRLYDEYLRVPLIMWGLENKGIVDRQIQLLDLAPTICDIVNIKTPPCFFGTSYFNNYNGGIIATSEYGIAFRTEDYKLIIKKSKENVKELYDLINDPLETNNIRENQKVLNTLESDMISILNNYNNQKKLTQISFKLS